MHGLSYKWHYSHRGFFSFILNFKRRDFPTENCVGYKRPEMSVHLWNSGWYNCCTTCSLGWGGMAVARGGAESWWLQSAHRFCFKQNESSLEVLILSKKGGLLRDVWLERGNGSPAFEEDRMGSSTKQTCSLCAMQLQSRQPNRDGNYSKLLPSVFQKSNILGVVSSSVYPYGFLSSIFTC